MIIFKITLNGCVDVTLTSYAHEYRLDRFRFNKISVLDLEHRTVAEFGQEINENAFDEDLIELIRGFSLGQG